jgi:hypothetical protein
MGTFFHPATIIGPNGEETVDALVDPSWLFAIIPAAILQRLGAEQFGPRRFQRPDGSIVERGFGQIQARLSGQTGHIAVILGEEGDPVRIGEHTLTGLVLEADLEHERLVEKTFRLVQHLT